MWGSERWGDSFKVMELYTEVVELVFEPGPQTWIPAATVHCLESSAWDRRACLQVKQVPQRALSLGLESLPRFLPRGRASEAPRGEGQLGSPTGCTVAALSTCGRDTRVSLSSCPALLFPFGVLGSSLRTVGGPELSLRPGTQGRAAE